MHTKIYKTLFEQIKKCAKRLHFSNLVKKYKNDIKMTWSVIKGATVKNFCRRQKFPKKIKLGSKLITSTDPIVENVDKYFTDIGPNLAKNINTPLEHNIYNILYNNNIYNIFQP